MYSLTILLRNAPFTGPNSRMLFNTQAQEGIIVGFSASSGVIQPKTNFNEELSSNFEPVSFVLFCLLRHTGPILDY